jgi:hypothetical protein
MMMMTCWIGVATEGEAVAVARAGVLVENGKAHPVSISSVTSATAVPTVMLRLHRLRRSERVPLGDWLEIIIRLLARPDGWTDTVPHPARL